MEKNKGKLIVIEGLDGSGKATQSKILTKRLIDEGVNAKGVTFPDYNNQSSALVKMYLDGVLGDNPDDVNAYVASSFYAVDRIASYLQFWKNDYQNGSVIVADRYSTSNIIYQMSKLSQQEYDDYIDWVYDYEYKKLMIPRPDLVIYLDVAPEISQKLLSKRYNGQEDKKDLHEKNLNFILGCRKSAFYAADKLNWTVIDCVKDGEIKSIDEISQLIYSEVKKML